MKIRFGILLCLFLLIPFILTGQQKSISGKVQTLEGEGIGGVEVTLNVRPQKVTKSNDKGEFSFRDIPPGKYLVTWNKTGWNFFGGTGRTVNIRADESLTLKVEAKLFWWARLMQGYVAIIVILLIIGANACLVINYFALPQPSTSFNLFALFIDFIGIYLIFGRLDAAWKVPMLLVMVLPSMTLYYIGKERSEKAVPRKSESSDHETDRIERERQENLDSLIGKEGITLTSLKWFGKVEVEGHTFEAKAGKGVLEKGVKIKVVDKKSGDFIVEAVD